MSATWAGVRGPATLDASYARAVAALCARRPREATRTTARIRALCAELGDPQRSFPSVHITGTNGKTTLAHMVGSLLAAHGVHVGTFTSPHLHDVRERIRVGGVPMSVEAFVARLEDLWPVLERVGLQHRGPVTFFEALVALAGTHFVRAGVEAGVIEVGVGGAHDATTVVDGRVAVLTTVALDHPRLGSTPTEVAVEKAGIITPGATVVSAPQHPGAARVIADVARQQGARLLRADHHFGVRSRIPDPGGQRLHLQGATVDVEAVLLPLHGAHQAANAACALAAAEAFLGDRTDPDALRAGFAAVRAPGRLERIDRPGRAPVLLDGAHNPAAAHALAASLASEPAGRPRVLVLGVCGDKDVAGIVAALGPVADHVVTTTAPTPRASPADHLAAIARSHGGTADAEPDVADALARATDLAGTDGTVVVTGSLYLVGTVRDLLLPSR